MALRQITCPHCEKEVELDVTSVTRSRDCPNCGKSILLDLITTQKREKRTALMVPSVDAVEELGQASHTERADPQPLEGHAHDRMMHDPDVRRNLRRLIWGTGILIGVIVLLCVVDRIVRRSSTEEDLATSANDASGAGAASDSAALDRPEPKPSSAKATLPPASPAPVASPASSPTEATAVAVAPKPPPSAEESAMEMLRSFLNAKNVDERLLTVRDLENLKTLIRDYYATRPEGPIPFTQITPEKSVLKNTRVLKFEVQMPDGQKRRAIVGRSNFGDYRVDWASFVIRSEMDWDDFMQKRPTAPIFMRVFMAPAPSASAHFPDSNYLCVKLTDPLNPASPPIYGYVGRDSNLDKVLNLLLRLYTGEPYSVRLTLKHPAQAQSTTSSGDQVLIDQFVGDGWLSGDKDFR